MCDIFGESSLLGNELQYPRWGMLHTAYFCSALETLVSFRAIVSQSISIELDTTSATYNLSQSSCEITSFMRRARRGVALHLRSHKRRHSRTSSSAHSYSTSLSEPHTCLHLGTLEHLSGQPQPLLVCFVAPLSRRCRCGRHAHILRAVVYGQPPWTLPRPHAHLDEGFRGSFPAPSSSHSQRGRRRGCPPTRSG